MKKLENFQKEFKNKLREKFPYPLEYFDRESFETFEIMVKRKLIEKEVSDKEFELIIQEFSEKLLKHYLNMIKKKAPHRKVSFEEFKEEVLPQKAYRFDNLFFVPFNLPIAFQDFNIDEKVFSIAAKVSLVDDLIKDNAAVVK